MTISYIPHIRQVPLKSFYFDLISSGRVMSGVMIYEKSTNTEALSGMDAQDHWEKIYTEKAPTAVSWYRPHLETSLELIEQVATGHSSSIIDVGGGESTLVDDLLARGYEDITVLDISRTAIDANRKRLGDASDRVHWLVADITHGDLPPFRYDVWHDRAVFHFLTAPADRLAYVGQVARAVKNAAMSSSAPLDPKVLQNAAD